MDADTVAHLELLDIQDTPLPPPPSRRAQVNRGCRPQTIRSGSSSAKSGAQVRRSPSSSEKENRLGVRKQLLSKLLKKDKSAEEGNRRIGREPRSSDRWTTLAKIVHAVNGSSDDDDDSSDSSSDDDDDQITIITIETKLSQPTKPKDSSTPKHSSPLSSKTVHPIQNPVRLSYPHRGHSRSSLLHQKSFWHERYEEWIIWHAQSDPDSAYGGIFTSLSVDDVSAPLSGPLRGPPQRRTSLLTGESSEYSDQQKSVHVDIKPALFPRMGDLSALRDPYLISADQCFANFPLWTLTKMAWIFDADHRAGAAEALRVKQAESANISAEETSKQANDESNADATMSLGTSMSDVSMSSSSSRGDMTLVEACSSQPKESGILVSNDILKSLSGSPVPHRAWETSWYARWDVFLHQVRSAEDLAHNNGRDSRPVSLCLPSFPPELAISSSEMSSARRLTGHVSRIDDEEDDYGELVQNPAFRMGASLNPYAMFAQQDPDGEDDEEYVPSLPSEGADVQLLSIPIHDKFEQDPFLESPVCDSWSNLREQRSDVTLPTSTGTRGFVERRAACTDTTAGVIGDGRLRPKTEIGCTLHTALIDAVGESDLWDTEAL